MGKLERAEILRAICRQRYGVTLSCSVRTGMGLIELGIKSLKAPRLSQLLKRRPNESMRGPNNADGRRFGWCLSETPYLVKLLLLQKSNAASTETCERSRLLIKRRLFSTKPAAR